MSYIDTTLNDERVLPYNTILGSKAFLLSKPKSTSFLDSDLSDFKFFSLDLQLLTCSSSNSSAGRFHKAGGVHISLIYLKQICFCVPFICRITATCLNPVHTQLIPWTSNSCFFFGAPGRVFSEVWMWEC